MEATARRIALSARAPYQMSLEERLLMSRLRARDEDAFSEVVRRYGDRVFNLVLRMVGNRSEAEDLAQEVFVTVFKSIDSFRGEARFSTWLFRIAANHAKNRIKHLARRSTESGDIEDMHVEAMQTSVGRPLQARVDGPDSLIEAAELGSLLESAIGQLDDEQRLLVILRDIEDLSYEEICEITSLPEGTVKSRIHRARMTLKSLLEKNTR